MGFGEVVEADGLEGGFGDAFGAGADGGLANESGEGFDAAGDALVEVGVVAGEGTECVVVQRSHRGALFMVVGWGWQLGVARQEVGRDEIVSADDADGHAVFHDRQVCKRVLAHQGGRVVDVVFG